MYVFFAKFIYNEYIRPYLLSHVVSTIFTTQNMIFSVWLDLVLLPPYHAQH
jgi:hypothetical protein